MAQRAATPAEHLGVSESQLWLLAVLSFGVGDVLTTAFGLTQQGVIELGPLVATLLEQYGLVALLGVKLWSLLWLFALWILLPRPYRTGIPLGLVFVGVTVTAWNGLIILRVML